VGNVTYLGGKNGQNPELEAAKAEALRIQNALNRFKLEKLQGTMVEKAKVQLLVGNSMIVLRTRLLELPRQLIAQLRGLDIEHAQLHGVKMRLEETVAKFLGETALALEQAANPQAAIDALDGDDDGPEEDDRAKTARELKREAFNARRREKRAAKS
jgi:hypothetical protein